MEAYLSTVFGMVAIIPGKVIAVRGSICSESAVSVIDVRETKSQYNRPVVYPTWDPQELQLPPMEPDKAIPSRMWIVQPAEGNTSDTIARNLSTEFESPRPPKEFSAFTLAKWAGYSEGSTRAVARVAGMSADSVVLDDWSDFERGPDPNLSVERKHST